MVECSFTNKWLWVRVQLQSLALQISRLFRARSSLKFRQLQSVDYSKTGTWHDNWNQEIQEIKWQREQCSLESTPFTHVISLRSNRVPLILSWRRPPSHRTSPLICGANQWTGFYMITASVMKGLMTWWFSWSFL